MQRLGHVTNLDHLGHVRNMQACARHGKRGGGGGEGGGAAQRVQAASLRGEWRVALAPAAMAHHMAPYLP